MLQYFTKKLVAMIPKLLVITMLVFFAMELVPVDPLTRSMDPDAIDDMSLEQLEQLREEKGLNKPVYVRYLYWLNDILHGNLGYSVSSGASIRGLLATRIPATLELCVMAVLLSSIIGVFMGSMSARFKNTIIDYGNTVLGLLGHSVPGFFFAMLFIMLFSMKLHWLPSGGRMTVGKTAFFDRIEYMILPSLCMAIMSISYLMRLTRNSMLDVSNKEYVLTARAKGQSETMISIKHVFRNGCTPVVLCLIGRLGGLVSGSVVIETVFNYPGMGMLIVSSIQGNDMPVAIMTTLIGAVIVLVTTFLCDIAIALLDPRVRFGKEE
ncbi:MAG: ABC transporter permease [Clostridia bacterium]|nr:ABC transporter permease [Clostridia bacterium]